MGVGGTIQSQSHVGLPIWACAHELVLTESGQEVLFPVPFLASLCSRPAFISVPKWHVFNLAGSGYGFSVQLLLQLDLKFL